MNRDLLVPSSFREIARMAIDLPETKSGIVWWLVGAWAMTIISNDPYAITTSTAYWVIIGVGTYLTAKNIYEFLATNATAQKVIQSLPKTVV